MPRKTTAKPAAEQNEIESMFKELEKDAEPTSGPESVNQPHLGGRTQKLEPEEVVSNVSGEKALPSVKKPKPKEVLDLSEGEASVSSVGGEMDFHTITLNVDNLRFIPGPKFNRLKVLRDWCDSNCAAGWKPEKSGLTWFFETESDAVKFNEAWNSRKIEVKEDLTDGAFYV